MKMGSFSNKEVKLNLNFKDNWFYLTLRFSNLFSQNTH